MALWIARCDELSSNQIVNEYDNSKFNELIQKLQKYLYTENYIVSEKGLSGTKVRCCFKVRGKTPAIYTISYYSGKDSFYFELFHELGYCKNDYNMAQNKTVIDGDEEIEQRADNFALKVINSYVWNEILNDISVSYILEIFKKYRLV